jgi:hypothetical protein
MSNNWSSLFKSARPFRFYISQIGTDFLQGHFLAFWGVYFCALRPIPKEIYTVLIRSSFNPTVGLTAVSQIHPLTWQGKLQKTESQTQPLQKNLPLGHHDLPLPVVRWNRREHPRTLIKAKKDLYNRDLKRISYINLPSGQKKILKQNRNPYALMVDCGARRLNELLGFTHVPETQLGITPYKFDGKTEGMRKPAAKDLFLLQEVINGMTVQDGLASEDPSHKQRTLKALGHPENLFPLYCHMVISGDSDRHHENMMVDAKGKLWAFDFEHSGGHDFYTYPDYESFSTQPELEALFATRPTIPHWVRRNLEQFLANTPKMVETLAPYYGYRRLQGMLDRTRILLDLGKIIPTAELFLLIRHTFYLPESYPL